MGRITDRFQFLRAHNEAALAPYLTIGYPTLASTRDLLCGIVSAGADMVELGLPFSDPLADGATLQRMNQVALQGGVNLVQALELVSSVRSDIDVPLILMSYYNPLLRLGDQGFARAAAEAGIDGLIVPDLPVEESAPLRAACRDLGIDLIGMVAPTSPRERVAAIAAEASGFVYCVSLRGVTGARHQLSAGVADLVDLVHQSTDLPAVVGFGISTLGQVREVTAFADGVVVASALMDRIERQSGNPVAAAVEFVRELKAACRSDP